MLHSISKLDFALPLLIIHKKIEAYVSDPTAGCSETSLAASFYAHSLTHSLTNSFFIPNSRFGRPHHAARCCCCCSRSRLSL